MNPILIEIAMQIIHAYMWLLYVFIEKLHMILITRHIYSRWRIK